MTEANLYDLLFLACMACPGGLPELDHTAGDRTPDAALGSVVKYCLVAELVYGHEGWSGWGYARSVNWARENAHTASWPPRGDLERMPPEDYVWECMALNRRVAELADLWAFSGGFRRQYWLAYAAETRKLGEAWYHLSAARSDHSSRGARYHLNEFRTMYPYYYRCPALLPAFP